MIKRTIKTMNNTKESTNKVQGNKKKGDNKAKIRRYQRKEDWK